MPNFPYWDPRVYTLLGPLAFLLTNTTFFATLEPLFEQLFFVWVHSFLQRRTGSQYLLRLIQFGCIAQSVEQWPLKPTVVGSIPTAPTRHVSQVRFLVMSL